MKRYCVLLALLVLVVGGLGAKPGATGRSFDLQSDSYEYDLENNVLTAVGAAKLTTESGTLNAEKIRAEMDKANKNLNSATAEGKVTLALKQAEGRSVDASCLKVVYANTQKQIRLTGNVSVLIRDVKLAKPARLTGATAVIEMLASGGTSLEAQGGARLETADGDLKADLIQSEIVQGAQQVGKSVAQGNVHAVMHQGADRVVDALCDQAEMMPGENKAVLIGKVTVTVTDPAFAEPTRLTGEKATVFLTTPRKIVMESNGTQTQLRIRPKQTPPPAAPAKPTAAKKKK